MVLFPLKKSDHDRGYDLNTVNAANLNKQIAHRNSHIYSCARVLNRADYAQRSFVGIGYGFDEW